TWLRSLSQAERDRMFNGGGERLDPAIIEAVISAPAELSGVASSNLQLMQERLLKNQFPGVAQELANLEKAIDVTERAVNVNTTKILDELSMTKEKFAEIAEPVLREVDATEASAMKTSKQEDTIDADAVAEQIKGLPYEQRSRLIDLAIDSNAD